MSACLGNCKNGVISFLVVTVVNLITVIHYVHGSVAFVCIRTLLFATSRKTDFHLQFLEVKRGSEGSEKCVGSAVLQRKQLI